MGAGALNIELLKLGELNTKEAGIKETFLSKSDLKIILALSGFEC